MEHTCPCICWSMCLLQLSLLHNCLHVHGGWILFMPCLAECDCLIALTLCKPSGWQKQPPCTCSSYMVLPVHMALSIMWATGESPRHGKHAGSAILLGIAQHTVAILHKLPPSFLNALSFHLHVWLVVLGEAVCCPTSVYDGTTVTYMRCV